MSYNRSHARNLCTSAELALFEASLADSIRDHTPARLRAKIARARSLRDKYRDVHRRQSLATRGRTGTKHGAAGTANDRTRQKSKLFAEALARFETRAGELERIEAAAVAKPRATKAVRRKVAAGPARGSRAKKKARRSKTRKGFVDKSAQAAAREQKLGASRSRPIQAHVRSRGKRAQARRDSR